MTFPCDMQESISESLLNGDSLCLTMRPPSGRSETEMSSSFIYVYAALSAPFTALLPSGTPFVSG